MNRLIPERHPGSCRGGRLLFFCCAGEFAKPNGKAWRQKGFSLLEKLKGAADAGMSVTEALLLKYHTLRSVKALDN